MGMYMYTNSDYRATGTYHVATDTNTVVFAGRPYGVNDSMYVIAFKSSFSSSYITNTTSQGTAAPSSTAAIANAKFTINNSGNTYIRGNLSIGGTQAIYYPLWCDVKIMVMTCKRILEIVNIICC